MLSINEGELWVYCEKHSTNVDEVLQDLERQTHLRTLKPQMISGLIQGRLLSFISQISQPKYILEIGTFTGYAALCLAEGLSNDGCLYTIEVKNEYAELIEQIAAKSRHFSKIRWIQANAMEWLPANPMPWDIVFLDADKKDYLQYLDILEMQMKPGAILIADNMLWHGKVLAEVKDKETQVLHQYNQRISASPKWKSFLLPVRDGLQISIRTADE